MLGIKAICSIYVALVVATTHVAAIWPNQPSPPSSQSLVANATSTTTPTPTWYFEGKAMPANDDTESQCTGSDLPRDSQGACVGPAGHEYLSIMGPSYGTASSLARISVGGLLLGLLTLAIIAL
ncbi:hypothetical protein B0A55_06395 [Friedmanniomyces simplex]|uniref:Uncharacterized protein n=1 Tax=Friedmanniomyces simplex TaxID=329884 RepID=A0A4U0XHP7_9PEZI|nr:hypothetical protein B0A55_06395 [Friedmanniomyces simplex]